jgi:SAM-dependent methyltransferase
MRDGERLQAKLGSTADLVLEHVPCNLCGSVESRVMYRKPDTRYWISPHVFDAVRCRRCGLGFVNPRPTRESIRMFYPDSFYERREVATERRRYDLQARFLDEYPRGRLLDIGCAGGAFLKVLQERAWQTFGMDLVESKNEYGIPIRYGELPDLGYPSENFDVVTAWAAFEHLHDPRAYFLEVGRILRPGGHFVCLVTNLNSVWSRLAYAEDIPRHLYFYSPHTLRRYAALAGLRVERIDYSGRIFSPDSTDVFRVRLLRRLGFGWSEIYRAPERLPVAARLLARGARLLGVVLLRRQIESLLQIGGILVAVMEKPR